MSKYFSVTILSLLIATSVAAQTKFLQKMKMVSGDSMAINMTEVRYAVRLSDGSAKLFYGNPTTVYETASSFSSIISASCGNLIQFTQYIGSSTQVVGINPKWVARAIAVQGVSRTSLFMQTSGDIRTVSGSFQTVSGLLSNCSSGSGSDNWGSQYVRVDATLAGQGTLSTPLKIAQQSATSGQVLTWNGTTWLPTTPPTISDGDKGDVTVSGSGTVFTVDPNTIDSARLQANAVQSSDIKNGQVWKVDLAANSVDSTKISQKGVSMRDIAQEGATSGQVPKWNGNMWLPSTDALGTIPDGDKGDIDVSGGGLTWKVDTSAVDSTKIKDYSVNLKDIESASAPTNHILRYNGSRWVPSYQGGGDLYADSLKIVTKPLYEPSKIATSTSNTITWDADTTANLYLTLAANTALFTPENMRAGGRYTITVKQDASGGWALSLPSNVLLDDNASINTAPSSVSVLDCGSDGSNMYCAVTRYGQGEAFELLNTYYDSLEFWCNPAEFGNTFRIGTAMNCVTAFGQDASQYTEPTHNAHIYHAVASSSPDVELISGRICHEYDGTDDYLTVIGSRAFTLPQTSNFTIALWVKCTQDGVSDAIFSSTGDAGATGISLFRTTSNTLQFIVVAGVGLTVINHTHSALVNNAAGWVWVQITRNGTTGSMSVGGVSETLTYTTRTAVAGLRDIKIGQYGAGGSYLTGYISNLYIFNREMSATTLTRFKNFNPGTPNLSNMSVVRTGGSFTPNSIMGLDINYDFSDSTKLFKDNNGTVQVTTNGDNIRRVAPSNSTYLQKYAISPSSGRDPSWVQNAKNGRGASDWNAGSGDKLDLNNSLLLDAEDAQSSWFIVCKPDSSTGKRILSDGSTRGLGLSPVSGSGVLTHYEQNAYLIRADSFGRTHESYSFASILRKGQWNIIEMRHRGKEWYISVNGENLNHCTQGTYSGIFNQIGYPSTSSYIGQIGQIVKYNQYLTNPQADLVIGYLASRWAISKRTIDNDPDSERKTLITGGQAGPNFYIGFPYSKLRLDTIWVCWKETKNAHNDSYNASEGIFLRPYSKAFVPLAAAQNIIPDILPPDPLAYRDHGGSIDWLPDGRIIVSGTQYDGQASPGGRDSIKAFFAIRSLSGVMGAKTYITVPGYNWFSITEGIHVVGGNWYVSGYGQSSGVRYRVAFIKSTNSGASWTVVAEWNGNTLHGGGDPEEPYTFLNSDGRWMLFYREDVQSKIFMASTFNIDSWNVTQTALTEVGSGGARPGVIEMSDKTMVLQTGVYYPSKPLQRVSCYYTSKNGGRTWQGPIESDAYRTDVADALNMYGQPIDLGNGKCALIWGAELFSTFALPIGGYVANISYKIIRP